MLFLVFQLGQDRYALDAAQVVEVLPRVRIKAIPQAPRGVIGVFNYRESAVPVVDLSEWVLGQPAEDRLSTRLIVVRYSSGEHQRPGSDTVLGLLAEKATETVRRELSDFKPSGVQSTGAPYLGAVATDGRGLLQLVDLSQLLPANVRDSLFRDAS